MYTTKRINDDSYQAIQRLYAQSFNHQESIVNIRLKYDTSLFGEKNVGVLAFDEDHLPAAYYGVFPMRLSYQGKDYLIAQSGDTMTTPAHRKKGLFVSLAKETYELCNQLGIQLVFGFPNENSYPGFKKNLDWEFHGKLMQFRFSIVTLPICELAAKFPRFQAVYQSFVNTRLNKWKVELTPEVAGRFSSEAFHSEIKKDIDFFEYKLRGIGTQLIEKDGFTLLIKAKTHLYVGAVNEFNILQTGHFISLLKRIARKLGCKTLILTLSPNHWLFEYLSEFKEPLESHPIGFYKINNEMDLAKIQFIGADYDTF